MSSVSANQGEHSRNRPRRSAHTVPVPRRMRWEGTTGGMEWCRSHHREHDCIALESESALVWRLALGPGHSHNQPPLLHTVPVELARSVRCTLHPVGTERAET